MGVGFYTVYAVSTYNLTAAQAGELTFVMMVAQTLTYPFAGWLGDKVGHRRVMEIAALSGAGMAALSWLAPSGAWFVAVYFLLGISSAAAMVSNLSGVYDFSAPEERPTYIGLTATLVGIPSAFTPILGATVVSRVSYPALFALTTFFCLAGWAVARFGIGAPTAHEGTESALPEMAET
jgi:MFS family permease